MATITSATSGLSNATSTWVGGVVPVVGDKVIIAHPGTNALGSFASYVTSGAHAVGATSIPVVSGSGTIVAGECVQFSVQVGTDEDGRPILHNTYYKVAVGITGAGTLQIEAPGLQIAVPAGTALVNSGHVVTLEGTHVWGDDTSSSVIESNAIVVRGTLRASRVASSQLTCRGAVAANTGACYDFGADLDPIPGGVTATVLVNDSAALVVGKHVFGITVNLPSGLRVKMCGKTRTRNTRTAAAIPANGNTVTVDASVGWEVGDRIVLASPTPDPAGSQVVTISGGVAPNWTVSPAVTVARASGTRVGNLSSNVTFAAASASHNSSACFGSNGADAFARIVDVAFRNMGTAGGGTTVTQPESYGALGVRFPLGFAKALRVAIDKTAVGGTGHGISSNQRSTRRPMWEDCALYVGPNGAGLFAAQLSRPVVKDSVFYYAGRVVLAGFGGGASLANVAGGAGWTIAGICNNVEQPVVEFDGFEAYQREDTRLFEPLGGVLRYRGGSITGGSRIIEPQVASSGFLEVFGTTFTTPVLDGPSSISGTAAQECVAKLISVNGVVSDNRVLSPYQTTTTDLSVRRRGTYSARIKPNIASTPIFYVFTIPAVAGVPQTIKGSFRFDATYGTATPPRIDLAGQGVTTSFVAPATADAWHDFTLTFTPATTGDITVTVTVQSTSTAGFAWLDGVWHYPMIQSVRHFGFAWLPQAAQVVDPRITLTEAAALALPVVEDHTAQTITVSGPVTARQVFEACIADLCQTANLGRAVHISSATGDTFTTTYTVVLTGSGAITGVYVDATGTKVLITAPALVSGSRVQLFNVTDGVEVFNGVLSGTGLSLPATWTADKTIRLRVEHPDKLPLQTLGVLTSTGLSFLDVQADDTVYVGNGIDGSTCTEFSADGPNIQVDINDPDGVTSVQRLYAWMQWYQTTAAGIASSFFGALTAIDSATYVIDQALANIRLDNVSAVPVRVIGGYLARRDGSTIIAAASNSIQMDPGKAYVAPLNALSIPAGERLMTMQATGAVVARG